MDPLDGLVVSNFIVQALRGEDLTVYDGQQTRSFCYVDDLVDSMVKMMESDYLNIGLINVENPIEFTMPQFEEMILHLTNSKSKLINKPLAKNDPRQKKTNIRLAKKKLVWELKVNLIDGLWETISFCKKTFVS